MILMYHRVSVEDTDPWSLRVTPENFAAHLEILKESTVPTSLKQMAQDHGHRRISHKSVAVTFDDGYANNLFHAKPLLEKYEIPATVFVTSNYVKKGNEYWWDKLERVLLKPGRLPKKLKLNIKGKDHLWDLGTAVDFSEEHVFNNLNYPALSSQPGTRLYLYYSVWKKLRPLPTEQQDSLIEQINHWSGFDSIGPRLTHRSLTSDELPKIEQRGIIEIGGHTANHLVLSNHTLEVQRNEIQQCKSDLEGILNHPINSFSYPYGAFVPETIPLVKDAGFDCACSTKQETVWRKSHHYQLPRFEVQNWSGQEFRKRLSSWLNT
jgi:peptidoglycan/xylan/chitin deacetylase (PgdA/CDA1 family)